MQLDEVADQIDPRAAQMAAARRRLRLDSGMRHVAITLTAQNMAPVSMGV